MKKLLLYPILATSLSTLSCVLVDPYATGAYVPPASSGTGAYVPPPSTPVAKPAPSLTVHSAPTFDEGVQQLQLTINGGTHLLQNVSFVRPIPSIEYPSYAIPSNAKKGFMYKDVGAHEEDAYKMYIEAKDGKVTLYRSEMAPGEILSNWTLYRTFSY